MWFGRQKEATLTVRNLREKTVKQRNLDKFRDSPLLLTTTDILYWAKWVHSHLKGKRQRE